MSDIERPSQLLEELYEAERPIPPVDDAVRAAIRSGVERSLGPGSGPHDPGPPAPAARPGPSSALLTTAGAGLFAAGALFGAAIHASLFVPPPQAVSPQPAPVDEPAIPAPAPPPDPPATAEAAPSEPDPQAATPPPAPTEVTPRRPDPTREDPDDSLRQERQMIDAARASLLRGEHARALESLDRHARRFPDGQLSEDREYLAVRALVGAGRRAEAQARADRFGRAYPLSLLRPAVDAALDQP